VDALRQNKPVEVSLDLLPAFDEKALDDRLLAEASEHGKKEIKNLLATLLPASLIPVGLELIDISPELEANQLTVEERRRLRRWLKDFRLSITGHRSFKEAVVTAGGVDLSEVDPRTMESKLIRDLYFACELLDIDGQTGGYNLQAAFSTGWLAGRSAAGATTEP
jgi:predicted Rossmann fold flavoprotein